MRLACIGPLQPYYFILLVPCNYKPTSPAASDCPFDYFDWENMFQKQPLSILDSELW